MPRILISIIFLLFVLILGLLVIWPKYQDLKDLQYEIEQKQLDLQYKEEYFQNLNKTSKDLQNYKSNLQKIDSALPLEPDLPSLFTFFQNLAAQTGLVLEDIKSGAVTEIEETEVKRLSVSLSLSGTYLSLKNFLMSLEKNARLFETKGVSFGSPGEGEIFDFRLSIETYSY